MLRIKWWSGHITVHLLNQIRWLAVIMQRSQVQSLLVTLFKWCCQINKYFYNFLIGHMVNCNYTGQFFTKIIWLKFDLQLGFVPHFVMSILPMFRLNFHVKIWPVGVSLLTLVHFKLSLPPCYWIFPKLGGILQKELSTVIRVSL